MLQKLRMSVLVFALFMLSSSVANAMLKEFEFAVDFDSGNLSGQEAIGMFTLDDFTGSGLEEFDPNGPLINLFVSGQVTAFQITVNNISFDITKDTLYPDSPVITTLDGVVTDIIYNGKAIDPSGFIDLLSINYRNTGGTNEVSYTDPLGNTSLGQITSAASVPEPATLALLSLGLTGLGFTRRKMKA